MKRILSLFLCFTILFLVSCGNNAKNVKATYNDKSQLEADNGVTYNYAPGGYQPTNQGSEYGLIEGILEEKLYSIGECDPEKWLTTEYAGFATTVFYADSITLPTLKELSPELCYICEEEETVISHYTLGSGELENIDDERELIDKIVSLVGDESIEAEMWPRVNSGESFVLKFYSEKWPAIYYCLEYVREGSGGYLYDYLSKKCINIGDILEGYFGSEN